MNKIDVLLKLTITIYRDIKVTNSRHSQSSVYADVYLQIAICILVIFNFHVLHMQNHHKMADYLTPGRGMVKTSGTLK